MEDRFSHDSLRDLLHRLGTLLEEGGSAAAIVVVGGAALSLLGVVARTTVDIDVIGVGVPADPGPPTGVVVQRALPPAVESAVARLTRDLALPPGWINTAVTSQGHLTLPPGFAGRVAWQRLGGLWLGLAGRLDLIALKLHAAVDTDIRSRHYQDLLALAPSDDELAAAARWVRTQDAGAGFTALVDEVIAHVRADLA